MRIIYSSKKVEQQCTSAKAAKKCFGGNDLLARSLLARINALAQAEVLKDIVVQPQFRFHKLENVGRSKLSGCFAMDVKTRRDRWRIILQPLDENEEPFDPCNIDEIASVVRIVKIAEVSNHYE